MRYRRPCGICAFNVKFQPKLIPFHYFISICDRFFRLTDNNNIGHRDEMMIFIESSLNGELKRRFDLVNMLAKFSLELQTKAWSFSRRKLVNI